MYDFKFKTLHEYQKSLNAPMTLFKNRDVQFLHSRHDTINIMAISDKNTNDYEEVLKQLESECKEVDEN